MTKLLEKALAELERVRDLPEDRQDELAEVLLTITAQLVEPPELHPWQEAELVHRLNSDPDYATDEETEAFFSRFPA